MSKIKPQWLERQVNMVLKEITQHTSHSQILFSCVLCDINFILTGTWNPAKVNFRCNWSDT